MCTRLHAIGFPCEMSRATAEFISDAALGARRRISCPLGEYRVWRSPAGAEIWLHYPLPRSRSAGSSRLGERPSLPRPFHPIDDLRGMTVAHSGASDVTMDVARITRTSKDDPLDRTAQAALPSRRAGERPLAFSFDLIGAGTDDFTAPARARIQIIGLAQKAWAYPSEAAYLTATPARRLVGRGALAEVGLAELPDVPLIYRPKPGTLWLATGEIKRSIRLLNPVTREPYCWILLATDRGDIDVLINPDRIEGDISNGHTLQAVMTVAGRLLARVH